MKSSETQRLSNFPKVTQLRNWMIRSYPLNTQASAGWSPRFAPAMSRFRITLLPVLTPCCPSFSAQLQGPLSHDVFLLQKQVAQPVCMFVQHTPHVQGTAPASALGAHYGSTHSDSMWQKKERMHFTELSYKDSLEKTLMLGQWRQKEKRATENKMVGWHHCCKGHKLGQTLGVGEGQVKPGMLQSTGSCRVGHNLATEQQQQS